MTTFWLYYGDKVVTGVRLHNHATADEVIAKALADHARVPLCDQNNDHGSKTRRIMGAHVRVFPNLPW